MNIVEGLSENELVNASSSALMRIADADQQNSVSREVNQFTARGQIGSAQSSGQTFGLAAATVFFVMLMLNAISY
jgi:hypothetical protein